MRRRLLTAIMEARKSVEKITYGTEMEEAGQEGIRSYNAIVNQSRTLG